MKIGIGISIEKVQHGTALKLNESYQQVYAAMIVKPSNQIASLQSNLVETLVDGGIFPSKVARLFILGSHSIVESVVDFVDPTRFAKVVNAPEFTANQGYNGISVAHLNTGYLDLGFNPATETNKFTQNNAGFGVYLNSNNDGAYSELGHSDGSRYVFINPRTGNLIHALLNEAVGGYNTNIANTDSRGFYFVTRRGADGATKKYVYKNKVQTALTTNSTGVVNRNMWGLCYNGNGTITQNSVRQNGLIIITSGLTEAEENVLSDAVNLYFASVALASMPYAKSASNYYKSLAYYDPNLLFYLNGDSGASLTRSTQTTEGTPSFTDASLTQIDTGKCVTLKSNDRLLYANASLMMPLSRYSGITFDFMLNYTAVGIVISKIAANIGVQIEVDTDGRLKASAIANLGGNDFTEGKTDEVLTAGVSYHCTVIFNNSNVRVISFNTTPSIYFIINGKEQAVYPKYEAKSYRSLAATIANTGDLIVGSSTFAGKIDELAIYYNLGLGKYIQQRSWLAMYESQIPTWTKPFEKMNLILDQDIDSDPDDAGDLHTSIALKRLGAVNLLADIVSCRTTFSAPSARAIRDWWVDDTVIAAYQGESGNIYTDANTTNVYKQLRDQFRPEDVRTNYPEDLTTYRTKLAAAADNSVVIVTTGYLISISNLLDSPADGISSLTGMELVAAKVNTIFVVDNFYPDQPNSNVSYNPGSHPQSWKNVIENAPCKIIFSGAELGVSISIGAPVKIPEDYTTNPFRYAYYIQGGSMKRPTWGVLPQLIAAYGLNEKFILSHPFTQTINAITGLADPPVYNANGNRWFIRFADNSRASYFGFNPSVGNSLTRQVESIFAMNNTTHPAI